MVGRTAPSLADPETAAAPDLRLHDLGPLTMEVDGVNAPLRGARVTRILARLLVNVNRRVSIDALVDAVWGERVSEAAEGTLESHIWRLRKLMEPQRGRRQEPTYLVNDSVGYRLTVNPDNADSLRFAQLSEQGDHLLASGEPERALRRYELALSLWRGRPFEVVADEEWALASVARLEELYGQVNEQRVEALLRTGNADQAIGVLEGLTAELPYRERLWAQLMLGRYQVGRVEEALSAYRRVRGVLLDTMGLEPGTALRELHQRILEQDPTLDRPTRPAPTSSPAPPSRPAALAGAVQLPSPLSAPAVPGSAGETPTTPTESRLSEPSGSVHVPVRLAPLIGRKKELGRLAQLMGRHRLLTIVGSAGCGTTRLAIEVARTAASQARDGVWFVDLSGVQEPTAVAATIASTVGVAAAAVGSAASSLSSYVRDRQVLLVLDNCEHVLSEVRRICDLLLVDPSQCRVLATSREPIGIDGEVLWTLAPLDVQRSSVDGERSDAAELFWSKLESIAPQFEATEAAAAQVEQICAAVDGIPLAIELAAGRIRGNTVAEVHRQVQDGLADLSQVGRFGQQHHRTVERSIQWSVRLLSEAEVAVHARLSVLPGVFTVEAAVAVAGFGAVRAESVTEVLRQLLNQSLLAAVAPSRPNQPTRFRQLATVRAHAERSLAATGETDRVLDRRQAWLVEVLDARPAVDGPDPDGWHERVEDSHDTVVAELTRTLVDHPDPIGLHVTSRLFGYWYYRNRFIEGEDWTRVALTHDVGARTDRIETQLILAALLDLRGRSDLSAPLLRDVMTNTDLLDRRSVVTALTSIAFTAWSRQDSSLDFVAAGVRGWASSEDPTVRVYSRFLRLLEAFSVAGPVETQRRAAVLMEHARTADAIWLAWVLGSVQVVCLLLTGDATNATTLMDESTRLHRSLGATLNPVMLEMQGSVAVLSGDAPRGVQLLRDSRAAAYSSGAPWPFTPITHTYLDLARRQLTAAEFQLAWQGSETAS